MRKLLLLAAVLLALVLALTGCGGGGGPVGDTLDEGQRSALLGMHNDPDTFKNTYAFYSNEVFMVSASIGRSEAMDRAVAAIRSLDAARGDLRVMAGEWTGPDAGGWYTYQETLTDAIFVVRIRYFVDTYRFEFEETLTAIATPEQSVVCDGYLIFSGDPFLVSVYPVAGSYELMMINESIPAKMGFGLAFSDMELVQLTSVNAIMPEILVGNLHYHATMVIPGVVDIDDFEIYDASSSVPEPTSDTPQLFVTGTVDFPEDSTPATTFNVTVDLYDLPL